MSRLIQTMILQALLLLALSACANNDSSGQVAAGDQNKQVIPSLYFGGSSGDSLCTDSGGSSITMTGEGTGSGTLNPNGGSSITM